MILEAISFSPKIFPKYWILGELCGMMVAEQDKREG